MCQKYTMEYVERNEKSRSCDSCLKDNKNKKKVAKNPQTNPKQTKKPLTTKKKPATLKNLK